MKSLYGYGKLIAAKTTLKPGLAVRYITRVILRCLFAPLSNITFPKVHNIYVIIALSPFSSQRKLKLLLKFLMKSCVIRGSSLQSLKTLKSQ